LINSIGLTDQLNKHRYECLRWMASPVPTTRWHMPCPLYPDAQNPSCKCTLIWLHPALENVSSIILMINSFKIILLTFSSAGCNQIRVHLQLGFWASGYRGHGICQRVVGTGLAIHRKHSYLCLFSWSVSPIELINWLIN
jgi:hypothetical protein